MSAENVDDALTTAEAGDRALRNQSPLARRKDTITAAAVLLIYMATSASNTDFSDPQSWGPTVTAWLVGVAGIGLHALTKGAVTPAVVKQIVDEANDIVKRRG